MPQAPREVMTDKQKAIYEFIRTSTREVGYPPSIRDIAAAFDIASPNGVNCHLVALVKKGWLLHDAKKARSLTCVDPTAPSTTLPIVGHIRAAGLAKPAQPAKLKLAEIVAGCNVCLLVCSDNHAGATAGEYFIVREQEKYKPKDLVLWQRIGAVEMTPFSAAPAGVKVVGKVLAKIRPY